MQGRKECQTAGAGKAQEGTKHRGEHLAGGLEGAVVFKHRHHGEREHHGRNEGHGKDEAVHSAGAPLAAEIAQGGRDAVGGLAYRRNDFTKGAVERGEVKNAPPIAARQDAGKENAGENQGNVGTDADFFLFGLRTLSFRHKLTPKVGRLIGG